MNLPTNRHLLMLVTLLALSSTAVCMLLLTQESINGARIEDLLQRLETLESAPPKSRSNNHLQELENKVQILNAELSEVREHSTRLSQELAEFENRRAALTRELQNLKSGLEP